LTFIVQGSIAVLFRADDVAARHNRPAIPPRRALSARVEKDPASSFRDPAEYVYAAEGRIFQTVTKCHREDYEFVRDSGALDELARKS